MFIVCEGVLQFVDVQKIRAVPCILPVVECLNIINMYAVDDPITGTEHLIYSIMRTV